MVDKVHKFSFHCPSVCFGIGKEEKYFHNYKTHFSFFFCLDPSYFQNSKLSHFFFISNDLKCYRSVTLSLQIIFHHNNNRATQNEVFGCSRIGCGLLFWVLNPPYFGGGHNFFISNLFLMILNASNAPRGRVQQLLTHQKKRALPLDLDCPNCLSVLKLA
jgi:hypothetical protein